MRRICSGSCPQQLKKFVQQYKTQSEDETIALGRELARELPRKCVVLLMGNLGAGKTALAKGILSGLGAAEPDEVTSPTFTLIHEYGNGSAYHIDLYRLDTVAQVRGLGIEELFDRDAVVLIEWGERFPDLLPRERVEIEIGVESEHERTLNVRS